ncbi:hypothetical protein B5E87_07290 [Massilimicrobiota sp. An142]|uniref:hypothetical protein n=1 Tax=Massilimicrobiota sp. An142 TaxID=1965564 RepID=UPI000B389B8E|nr:hypothetical protein [Massilimicrobiota sp. An142]OUQ13184.1 hypothetical protein B5E87_07290 [Massilimicrobiota sp. An142]
MHAYSEAYVDDVVENQGRLFDYFAQTYPNKSTEDFIVTYMKSKTRKSIDDSKAYVMTMDFEELWNYFYTTEDVDIKDGETIPGFIPDWIGEFYAYYQWFYNTPSSLIVEKIPVNYLIHAYPGLHDLDLELAVKKVGEY